MTETFNHPESARRQLQIQKLLEAINNYSPSSDEIEAMNNAKKQMMKNIQKKFALSKLNLTYQFPFQKNPLTQSDTQQIQEIPQFCFLKIQNPNGKQNSKSKYKYRRPLQEKSSNNSQANLYSLKKVNHHSKTKQKDSSLLKNIEKAFKNGLNCQTPKVIKKQIVLTNKKHPLNQNTKNQLNYDDQRDESQISSSTHIKAKLKKKKSNNSLNQAKKHIHLRTQNNINFKHHHEFFNSKSGQDNFNQDQNDTEQELFNQARTQQKYVIYEEPSEESMFFNSRNNQNIDQNTNFQYPKALFNVSDLKQKLRQTSKSNKKDFTKRHKRTATEGCAQIKIKLFSNSFKKNSCEKTSTQKKFPFPSSLFKKNQHVISNNNLMNRTVSSLSQHSLKKGIKLCGKIEENGERILSKGSIKYDQIGLKQSKKYTISKLGKGATEEINFGKEKRNLMSTHSFVIKDDLSKYPESRDKNSLGKDMKIDKKSEKENIEINKISKINSIMTSLKQGYKVKNGAGKFQTGIKTTICR